MGSSSSLNQPRDHNIILFDGVCNLCNGSVLFIIKRDPKAKFKYASLQSDYGQKQLERLGKDKQELHSIILLRNDKVYERSNAALEIVRQLTGLWPVLYSLKIIPLGLRDALYNWIAKNRYRFFGKKDQCMIPTPDLRSRFIE